MHSTNKTMYNDVVSDIIILKRYKGDLNLYHGFWPIKGDDLESVIVLCFVVRYFMPILVLQSSWWGRESWLLCLICLPGVSWWLSCSSSRCHRVVCGLWLWYFLIILTYYFWHQIQFYPFKRNGISHSYQWDPSISVLRATGWYFPF